MASAWVPAVLDVEERTPHGSAHHTRRCPRVDLHDAARRVSRRADRHPQEGSGVPKCQGLSRNAVAGRDRLTNGRCGGTMLHFFRTERSAKPPRVANSSGESRICDDVTWLSHRLLICWFSVRFRAGSPNLFKINKLQCWAERRVTDRQQIFGLVSCQTQFRRNSLTQREFLASRKRYGAIDHRPCGINVALFPECFLPKTSTRVAPPM